MFLFKIKTFFLLAPIKRSLQGRLTLNLAVRTLAFAGPRAIGNQCLFLIEIECDGVCESYCPN
jgi:hypothetical protein